MNSLAATWPLTLLHDRLVLLEVVAGDDELRGHVLTLGPQAGLVDQDLAATLVDQTGRPGLGDPCTHDLAGLEGVQRGGVVLRTDLDVAATRGVGVESLRLQPGAQG